LEEFNATSAGTIKFDRVRQIRLSLQVTTMSIPFVYDEPYPGHDCSISQLLHAAKRKLQGTTSGGRFVNGG